MIGVAFGLGFIIGPLIGGLLGNFSPKVPFFVCAGLSFVNWLYGYFVLPESLPKENRRKFEWKRANPVGSLQLLKRYPTIGGLITSFILIYIGAHALQSTWSYYAMEKFKWKESQVGISLAVVGAMVVFVQGFLIRKTSKILGNEKSIYIGLMLYSVGMLLYAFATQGWMMYAFTVIYCLGGIAGPALQAIISNHVPANEQGELQGALNSIISITTIVGPLVMTNLFAYFTNIKRHIWFPGAPFIAGAVLMLLSAFFAYRVLYSEKHPSQKSVAP
jgi:DHA1 family tetracycline resistance protein-like MFS transporter